MPNPGLRRTDRRFILPWSDLDSPARFCLPTTPVFQSTGVFLCVKGRPAAQRKVQEVQKVSRGLI